MEVIVNVTVAENGRLVVPAQLRQQLGLPKGGKLVASIVNGALVLEPFSTAIRRARDLVKSYADARDGAVEELLAERRSDAAREEAL